MTPLPPNPQPANAVRRWVILLGVAAAVFTLDQTAKAWVIANLALGESITPIPAIADFFAITRSANKGAAFSLLPQASDIFLIIALVMIGVILVSYRRMQHSHLLEQIALGLLLGGVAGNALDRIRLGSVVDFVHLQLKPIISNVSNFADHAIVLGIGILFVVQWLNDRKNSKATITPPEGEPAESKQEPPIA